MTALIWCPFPDRDQARAVANILLDEKLIACANMIGAMESLFEWDGKRCEEKEVGMLFKTRQELLDQSVERLGGLHPYDSPAIFGWNCDAAHPSTKAWLASLGAST